MRARARAIVFFTLAGLAALAGALLVSRYREGAIESLGPLRPALVTTAPLRPATALEPRTLAARTTVRRVPERFLPADAISNPGTALGLETRASLPAGSYLTRSHLRRPKRARQSDRPRLGGGRQPVEIRVSGASALATAGPGALPGGAGPRVDVVVTSEPGPNGRGRTYIAAEGVPLLGLAPARDDPVPGPGLETAVLGLTRSQALELIRAESFARSVRLLPRTAARR